MEQFLNILFTNNTDEIFDNFIEQINNIPFEEYRNEELINFQLHERVVQNMYILRRNLELHSFNTPRSTPAPAPRSTPAPRSRNNFNIGTNTRTNFNTRTTNNEIGNLIGDIFDTFSTFLEDQINFVEDYSNLEDTKVVLTDEQFNTLNSVILNETDIKGDCPICMETMTLNDKLITLKCNHIYHNSCIREWLTKNSTKCCVCRKDVREELN
jgi:hypothetical protein